MKETVQARLMIRDVKAMDRARRKAVAEWLIRQAKAMLSEGDDYASRFTASFITTRK